MKYKLLKELPLAEIGEEVQTREITNDSKFLMIEKHSENITHLAMILKENINEWLEPIVEKKTYDDLKEGDSAFYIFNVYGRIEEIPFEEDDCRSEAFLTRGEAEDEHKRREWAARKDKFVPEYKTMYCFPLVNGEFAWCTNFLTSADILTINLGLAFRTQQDCQDAIDNHDLIRLFYNIR